MENESKFRRMFTRMSDWFSEQTWFQQLKGKWDELDARTKLTVQLGGAGALVLIVLAGALSAVWSVRGLEKELAEKNAILSLVQSANDELRRIREAGGPLAADTPTVGGWEPVFHQIAAEASIDKTTVTVSEPKPGTGMDAAKESLLDVALKNINARQLMRFVYKLENSAKPLKLRHLAIDTKEDMSGYLDATLSVSAFSPKE